MLFNSWEFIALLLPTLFLYYLFPHPRFQIGLLILASFIFYGSYQPELLLLLIASISINAVSSYRALYGPERQRKPAAILGVAVNLLVLALFKYNVLVYKSFFGATDANQDPILHLLLTIPLPIGISFFTFQGISLVVDAYCDGKAGGKNVGLRPGFARHFFEVSFFKSFFPQLVAGPIVKAHDFFPQVAVKLWRDVNWTRAIQTLILGYFLKMVVADNMKDQTYWLTYPYFQSHSTITLVFLLYGYSIQIFADFAGYSSIAIGLALLFGYEFPKNFYFPYIAQSFSEFWTRWHISLSSWLREYLYLPLGGNRHGSARTYLNLMIVMFLGGLWHGATWSYALWGTWHGVMLAVERLIGWNRPNPRSNAVVKALRMIFVFIAVTLAWLLFKLPDFSHVLAFGRSIMDNSHFPVGKRIVFNVALYSIPVVAYHLYYLWRNPERTQKSERFEALLYGVLLFCIVFNSGPAGAFIYFQF